MVWSGVLGCWVGRVRERIILRGGILRMVRV